MAEITEPLIETPTLVATTTAVVDEHPEVLERDTRRPGQDITQVIWTIICAVALPVVPINVVTSVPIYLIFHYRVIPREGWP